MDNPVYAEKLKQLEARLGEMNSAVVAYSGGVDSALLATLAARCVKGEVVLVTAASPTFTESEMKTAKEIAEGIGVRHEVMRTGEMNDPEFVKNDKQRCYYCKKIRFTLMDHYRQGIGLEYLLDGSNADDAKDYRPGTRAAKELGVESPLADAGLTKKEIRLIARDLDLTVWNAPSQACLASRVPYGTELSADLMHMVESAEKAVAEECPGEQVRVRHHGEIARIEVTAECFKKLMNDNARTRIVDALRGLGYHYVTLDLTGYRTGSMNEVLDHEEEPQK